MVEGTADAWAVAAHTPDPELPTLTLGDLGILRDVQADGHTVVATITPTYSGCPAMHEISADLRHRLQSAGFREVTVRTQLAPAWSSAWITAEGRRKLTAAGIAPPLATPARGRPIALNLSDRPPAVPCPRCGSVDTRQTAAFSATACKALHRCSACSEPFEYVKPL